MAIMKSARILLLLPILSVLAACVTTARFEQMMDSYLGVPIGELQQRFGYNYIERQLPDGLRAYTWVWKEQGVFPGYETPTTIQTFSSSSGQQHVIVIPGTYFPSTSYESNCEFTFVADAAGKTVTWRAHGNGCAHYTGPGKVLAPAAKP
ncbi:MAG: hypothetical protein AB1560_05935 [Pseudomonadota bacterium]